MINLVCELSTILIAQNKVPGSEELVLESDTRRFKFGNGVSKYNDLDYIYLYSNKFDFTAILNQSGTNNPTIKVLQSTFPVNPVISRVSAGIYNITLNGFFTEDKTIPISESALDLLDNKITIEWVDVNHFVLKTYSSDNYEDPSDNILLNQYLHLEVYK